MHAPIDGGQVKLPTHTGLDWSHRYWRTIEALDSLKVKSAYLDVNYALSIQTACLSLAGSRRRWMKAEPISLSSSPSPECRGNTRGTPRPISLIFSRALRQSEKASTAIGNYEALLETTVLPAPVVGYRNYGGAGLGGALGLVLIVLLVVWLAGGLTVHPV
jgi:hypothetical protein